MRAKVRKVQIFEYGDDAFYNVQPGQIVVRRSHYDPNIVEQHKALVFRNERYFEVESYPENSLEETSLTLLLQK